jgi:hypothetical protein
MKRMRMYKSLPHLAKYYDIHVDTIRKKLKSINIIKDEHFILIDKIVRFDVEKIHPLLISKDENQKSDEILKRLLI